MAPTKRKHQHHHLSPPSSPPSSSPASFISSISTVAVAQICVSIGYSSAEPSALRSLSSIASLYIQTLATSAASIAASKGRTQSNILDLIRAIEDLSVACGFAGASDPTRPLLNSSVIKDLRLFIRSVDEIPFAKPIRRWNQPPSLKVRVPSFAEAGREPPAAHVPRWLPCLPEGLEKREGERREKRRWEEGWRSLEVEFEEEKEKENGNGNGRMVMGKKNGMWNNNVFSSMEEGMWVKELMEFERERIRFRVSSKNCNFGG